MPPSATPSRAQRRGRLAATLVAACAMLAASPAPAPAAGKPAAAERAAVSLAKRITRPGPLSAAVVATREALAAGGVATVVPGAIVKQASLPSAPFTSRPVEVVNLALEAQDRETASRLTLADIAAQMKRMGFPFAKGLTPGQHMVRFLRMWVAGAHSGKAGKRSFAPLFLAAMAKRQQPALSLARGNYPARDLRLTLLEVELLGAAMMRSTRNGPATPPPVQATSAQATEENCTNFRDYLKGENERIFGPYAANVNRLLDLSVGIVSGFGAEKTLQAAIGTMIIAGRGGQVRTKAAMKVAGKHAGRAMAIFGVLMRAQKLYAFYDSVQVRVTPLEAVVHKPTNRVDPDRFTDIAGFAGIQPEKWEQYQAEKAALDAPDRALEKGARDCLKALGLPALSDAGDIAGELSDYRLKWTEDRSPHAAINDARSRPYVALRTKQLTRVSDTEAAATIVAQVRDEPRRNHTRGCDGTRRNYYTVTAELQAAQPPTASTLLGAATSMLGPGIADPIAEALAGLIQSLNTPSAEGTVVIESHVPDREFSSRARAAQSATCKGFAPGIAGTVGGTLTRADGVVETWTATVEVRRDPGDDSTDRAYYNSDQLKSGTIQWSISGTSRKDGCTYSGSGQLDATLNVALVRLPAYAGGGYRYEVEVNAGPGGPASYTCPEGSGSYGLVSQLGGGDFAVAEGSYDGGLAVKGSRGPYATEYPEGGQAEWSWDLRGTE